MKRRQIFLFRPGQEVISAAGSSGIPSVAQWLKHSSRSWVVVFFIAHRRVVQQRLILRRGASR